MLLSVSNREYGRFFPAESTGNLPNRVIDGGRSSESVTPYVAISASAACGIRRLHRQAPQMKSSASGSQPMGTSWAPLSPKACLPEHWPADRKGQPIKTVFRAMRSDFADLKWEYHPAMGLPHDSDKMRNFVCVAVVHGSNERSPFFHTSKSMNKSRKYAKMGEINRGEQKQMFCKIDIFKMLCDGVLKAGDVIDLSNHKALTKFFNKRPEQYGTWFEANFQQCCKWATEAEEVVIKWRGCIPLQYFSVVDDITGQDHGPLPNSIPPNQLPALQHKQPPYLSDYPWRKKTSEAADKYPDAQVMTPALPPFATVISESGPPLRKDTMEAGCRQDDSLPVVECLGDATPEALSQSVEDVPHEPAEEVQGTQDGVYHEDLELDEDDTVEAGCRQDDSLPVVESLGDATSEALIQSVEDVPQEALSQSLEELHPAFEAACNRMRNKRSESVAQRHLGVLEDLVHVEQAYVAELRECHEAFTSESRADIRTGGQINVCIGGGYTPDRQKARHAVKRDVAWSDVALKHAEGEEAARKRHRERLKMLAEKFKADFPGDCFMNDIPVNQHSKDCLQEVVDESTRETTEVNYTEALKKLGVLSLPPNSKGRKASTTARETPLTEMEEGSVYDWGSAWLKLGGFTSCTDKDKNGWTPLHHAIDSMTFSMRARHSAISLATCTPDSALEAATTGHQPPGWTALHFACEGSDVGLKKLDVVKILLGRRANVEARDAKGNTPLLLAAGTGLTDVCTTLLDSGADKDVTNINDHGAYRIADGCSRTLAEILLARGCPETHSQKSGRTRQGMSQSRLLRGSMTTSASSGYTSLSAARSYQQAPKVKGKKNCNWP